MSSKDIAYFQPSTLQKKKTKKQKTPWGKNVLKLDLRDVAGSARHG